MVYRMALRQPIMNVHMDLRALNADPLATDKGDGNFAVLEAVLVLLLEENLKIIDCIFAPRLEPGCPTPSQDMGDRVMAPGAPRLQKTGGSRGN